MDIEDIYRVERAKWDSVADAESADAGRLLPFKGFEEYARKSPRLAGVADFLGDLKGKRVLELGCGLGKATTMLAKSGATVSAFDLSPAMVDVARRRARLNGLDVDVRVAAGEELPYPDESFDVAVGIAVLHHLEREAASRELHRVLKPGGKAAFVEPLAMNPLLNFVRDQVPYARKTPRGPDRPLTYGDIAAWGAPFAEFRYREVQLLSMLERLFGYQKEIAPLRRCDDFLLPRLPFLRRYCRYVVLYMVR